MPNDWERIRLPDSGLKQTMEGGIAVISPGIAALGPSEVKRLFQTISIFDDYCAVKEPHLPGQFIPFDFDGTTIVFRIDYVYKAAPPHSAAQKELPVNERIITIKLSEEY
jgi:hypothetical protein